MTPDPQPAPATEPASPAPDPFALFRSPASAGAPGERLFHPDRALGWCFRRIPLIAVGPLALLLALDLALGLAHPRLSAARLVLADLSDWIFVSLTFALLAGALLFRRVLSQMPGALVQLGESGRLAPRPESARARTYSHDFAARVRSRARWLPIALLVLVAAAFTVLTDFVPLAGRYLQPGEISLLGLLQALWLLVRWMVAPLLWAYVAGGVIWVMLVIGSAVRDLTPAFRLDVQPAHPDGCGGLQRLGDLCFSLALPTLLGMLVASTLAILGIVLGARAEIISFAFIGLLILTPLSILTFFVPLWDVHQDMVSARGAYQDDVARLIAGAEAELRDTLHRDIAELKAQSAGDAPVDNARGKEVTARITAITDRLEALKKLYPTARRFPTWPFNASIFLRVLSPQLAPVVAILFSLTDKGAALKEVLTYLNQLLGGGS